MARNSTARMLERIGTSVVTTITPWTDGEVTFGGVLARDLMNAVEAAGSQVHAIALNDYTVDIPLSDLVGGEVLLALTLGWRAHAGARQGSDLDRLSRRITDRAAEPGDQAKDGVAA